MTDQRPNNRQTARDRYRLLEDFERRLQHAGPIDLLRRARSVAIVIHPTADEMDLLREINADLSQCDMVDAYWQYGDSVYWVQMRGTNATERHAGVYYFFNRSRRQDEFEVVLPHPLVYSDDLQRALDYLEDLIDAGEVEKARATFEDRFIHLGDLSGSGESKASGGQG